MVQTSREFKSKLHMIIIMNQIPFIYIYNMLLDNPQSLHNM
jgi:hypothetical protein